MEFREMEEREEWNVGAVYLCSGPKGGKALK